jgi:hypothetical protein
MVIVTTAVYWRLSSPPRLRSRVPLTFQHRAGVSPYTSPYGFARTCVFSKQSLPAGLCDPLPLRPQGSSQEVVPLLPKLRGHFAEFLDHSSPERLGILYQTTCVGLGYGPQRPSLEAFLDSIGSTTSPLRAPHQTSGTCAADLPTTRPTSLARDNHRPGPPTFLRHPIARLLPAQITNARLLSPKASQHRAGLVSRAPALAVRHGYGNINPLSIDYACRPRLRPRLTLGGTAWPRNPWSIGANDSHVGYRYSCLHSHSRALHHSLTGRLHRMHDAPLPVHAPGSPPAGTTESMRERHGFGGVLEPRYIIGAGPLDQ